MKSFLFRMALAAGSLSAAFVAGSSGATVTGNLNGAGSLVLTSAAVTFNNAQGVFGIDISSTSSFAPLAGTTATLQSLTLAADPPGVPVSVANFMTFAASPAASLTLTLLRPGVFSSAACGAAPAAGQTCTLAGSPFNFTNLTTTSSMVSFAIKGTIADGSPPISDIEGVFTAQFDSNYQTVLATIGTGQIGTTYSASFTSAAPVSASVTKSFAPANIPLNGTSTMTIALTNPNPATALTIAISDPLPTGLVVAGTPAVANACGGSVTAVAGTATVSLTGGSLAAGASCAVSVDVQGTLTGVITNIATATSTGAGTSTGTATLTVIGPPTIAKTFSPAAFILGGGSFVTFTLTNPAGNPDTLAGVGFTDILPGGLAVSNGSSPACGGTVTSSAGNMIVLAGASIVAGGTCQFSVPVFAQSTGTFTNTTGNVASANGGTGGVASATVVVAAPTPIPTLDDLTLIALAALLAVATCVGLRRKQR